jgi:hypothetical protein
VHDHPTAAELGNDVPRRSPILTVAEGGDPSDVNQVSRISDDAIGLADRQCL